MVRRIALGVILLTVVAVTGRTVGTDLPQIRAGVCDQIRARQDLVPLGEDEDGVMAYGTVTYATRVCR